MCATLEVKEATGFNHMPCLLQFFALFCLFFVSHTNKYLKKQKPENSVWARSGDLVLRQPAEGTPGGKHFERLFSQFI